MAIVYISHHLEEAIEIADYAVVFRDGELVATEEAANIDLRWVVRQMVGREADYDFRDEPRDFGDVALSIQGVTVAEPDTGRVVGQQRLAGRTRGRDRLPVRPDGCRPD